MEQKTDIDEDTRVTPIWTPRLITGGKGPPGHNWLKRLKEGAIFLCRNTKEKVFTLGEFHVNKNFGDCIQLLDNTNPGPEVYFWVDSEDFCKQFELKRILYEPEDGST